MTEIRTDKAVLVLVWLLCAVYMFANLKRGWVPHDEGILAQAADRVLQGEMPHRDFNDPYTGGLSYLNASAFQIFGENLLILRYVLFAFFLAWVPSVYGIARSFLGAWPSAGITMLAVAWSVPNYSAAMPSWFCLFFATFGALATLRYIRHPRAYWLFLAGLCGGLSFLTKTPGLYFAAGMLLFFVYREQDLCRDPSVPTQNSFVYFAFVVLALTVFMAVILKLILTTGGAPEVLNFVVPPLLIVSLLISRDSVYTAINSPTRFKRLLTMTVPFMVGLLSPLVLFVLVYWHGGGVRKLAEGLFVLHLRRLFEARMDAPKWYFAVPSVLAVVLLSQISQMRGRLRVFVLCVTIGLGAFLLATSRANNFSYELIFYSVRSCLPVLTFVAVIFLYRCSGKSDAAGILSQQILLMVAITVMCSFVQFPFAAHVYFCYVAPLVFLSAAALLSALDNPPRSAYWAATGILIVFAIFVFRPGFLKTMGSRYSPDEQTVALQLARARGLHTSRQSAELYDQLIPFVSQIANGQPILAGPDSPEIYFLSGVPNPTPIFFDFFQAPEEYKIGLEQILDRPNFIHVAVLNNNVEFSRTHLTIFRSLVCQRFSKSQKFDSFEVFWRP